MSYACAMARWRALVWVLLSTVACGRSEEKTPTPATPTAPATPEPAAATAAPEPPVEFVPIGDGGAQLYLPDGAGPAADPVGIRACCDAVHEHARQAPPQHQTLWNAAAKKCNEASAAGLGRASLSEVRDLLKSVGSPSVCQ
jgi:hypothetical protein